MKGLWAIVIREVQDKRTLLLGALPLGVIPWIAPFVPGLSRFKAEDVRVAFMLLLGITLPPALALGFCASVVGEEVAGRRLGFYFARPLGAWAIWGGKMLVALLVPLTAAVVIFTPLTALPGLSPRAPFEAFGWSLAASVLLGALAHAGAGLYRTRSPLLALDLALAALVAGAFYFVGWQMVDGGARDVVLSVSVWLAVALVVICLAAGFAQVAYGRSDPRRGHLALAATLWGGLLLCLAASAALARFYLSPELADVRGRTAFSIGDGEHFLLSGFRSRGRDVFAPWFAVDIGDGSARRVAANLSLVAVSPNGRHTVLIEGVLSPRLVLVSAVAGQTPVVTRAALGQGGAVVPLCLSDDGALAILQYNVFAHIVDTATGKPRPGPRLEAAACTFEGRSRVVLYRQDVAAHSLDRSTFDLASGSSAGQVHFAGAEWPLALRGHRLLARMGGAGMGRQVALFEANTGRLVRSLGRAWVGRSPGALLLQDGRAAVMDQGDIDNTVRLFDPEGRELWAAKVGERGRVALNGQTSSGEIVVASWSSDSVPTTLYLDGATGAVSHKLEGLSPAEGSFFFGPSDPTSDRSGPRVESRLFTDRAEAIYRVDPTTGQRRLIVPGETGS